MGNMGLSGGCLIVPNMGGQRTCVNVHDPTGWQHRIRLLEWTWAQSMDDGPVPT